MVAAHTFVLLIKAARQVIQCVGVHSMAVTGHHSMMRASPKAGFPLKHGILSDNSDKN